MTEVEEARFSRPITVALLTPYFAFFEQRFPPDFRSTQAAYASGLAAALRAEGLLVVESELVDGAESAAAARERFATVGVDVVVVAATMAAPPTYALEALVEFEGPVIVWDDRRVARYASDVDEVEATRGSGMLGSIMLTNVLGREGRPYRTVSTSSGDAGPIAAAVRGAAAARSLRGARLGLLGGIIAGYGDVVLDEDTADLLGIELVTVDVGTIAEAVAASTDGHSALPAAFRPTDDAQPLVDRSLRVHRFLTALVADERLDAIALNCHSDVLRFGDELGIVGCLAATLLWGSGVPVACTGDAATTVALMLAARISGSAQYCEGYTVEAETGELVVSSCGMADVSLCPAGEQPGLYPNELYPGTRGLGLATRFTFDSGPATIAAFGPATPTMPPRLVIAESRLTGRGFEHLNGPSGTVEFDRNDPGRAREAWIDAGPAHHLALMRGARAADFRAAAAFLGIELIEVGGSGPAPPYPEA